MYLSGAPEGVFYIFALFYVSFWDPGKNATETINIEWKLRSMKVRLFIVPCYSIILFSSEDMKKKCILTYSYFFRYFIILVGSIIEFSPIFPIFTSSVL